VSCSSGPKQRVEPHEDRMDEHAENACGRGRSRSCWPAATPHAGRDRLDRPPIPAIGGARAGCGRTARRARAQAFHSPDWDIRAGSGVRATRRSFRVGCDSRAPNPAISVRRSRRCQRDGRRAMQTKRGEPGRRRRSGGNLRFSLRAVHPTLQRDARSIRLSCRASMPGLIARRGACRDTVPTRHVEAGR